MTIQKNAKRTIVAFLFFICLIFAFAGCKEKNPKDEKDSSYSEIGVTPLPNLLVNTPTVAVQPTVAPEIGIPAITPAAGSEQPSPTPNQGIPSVTTAPIQGNSNVTWGTTTDGFVSAEAAKILLQFYVDRNEYQLERENDLTIRGESYYVFRVYSNDSAIDPAFLVPVRANKILCRYDNGTVKDFVSFPFEEMSFVETKEIPQLDEMNNVIYAPIEEKDNQEETTMSVSEMVYLFLCGFSKETLGLSNDLFEYTISSDVKYLSVINGIECYRVDLKKAGPTGGMMYVTTLFVDKSLSSCYRYDEESGIFDEIVNTNESDDIVDVEDSGKVTVD